MYLCTSNVFWRIGYCATIKASSRFYSSEVCAKIYISNVWYHLVHDVWKWYLAMMFGNKQEQPYAPLPTCLYDRLWLNGCMWNKEVARCLIRIFEVLYITHMCIYKSFLFLFEENVCISLVGILSFKTYWYCMCLCLVHWETIMWFFF